ncbi:hypothetical protein CEXT_96211, partial [Caerostris extrusa]
CYHSTSSEIQVRSEDSLSLSQAGLTGH